MSSYYNQVSDLPSTSHNNTQLQAKGSAYHHFYQNKQSLNFMKLQNQTLTFLRQVFIFLVTLGSFQFLFAEGTRTVSPTSANLTALGLLPSTGSGSYLGCPQDNRIYFRIKDHTVENLYYGFAWCVYQNVSPSVNPTINTVYMRIYTSAGTQVAGPIQLNNTGAGYISSYTQGYNGPNIGGATPTGYTPLMFDPTVNDDYYIELYRSGDGGATQLPGANDWSFAPYFDLTVATTANVQYTGRVHCDKWSFVAMDPSTFNNLVLVSSDVSVVGYTGDSTYVKFDIQPGFMPIAFNLSMNNYGITNTSNWTTTDRQSIYSATAPSFSNGFPLFLNIPDSTLYPYSSLAPAPTFENPIMLGCGAGGPFKIRYKIYKPGDVYILFNFNGTAGYQAGTSDRLVEITNSTTGSKVYTWDGKDGLGATMPIGTNVPLSIYLRRGRVNMPIYDAEVNKNGFILSGIKPQANANLRLYWDDSPLANNGSSCAAATDNANNITGGGYSKLEGKVSPAHAWNGNGNSGDVIPAPAVGGNDADQFQCNDFGNVRAINTWSWGEEVNVSSNVIISCLTISGTVWDDANNSANGTNSNIFTTGESGTNVGSTLYATLIDPSTGLVLSSVAVAANGTYSFSNVPANATNLTVRLTNSLGVVDNTPPSLATLSSGWVQTSPLTQNVSTTTSNLTGVDFGVEHLPSPTSNSAASQVNPGGTNNATVTATLFSGTDPDGTISNIRITSFPTNATSITINGTQYTSATFPVGGVTVPTNTSGNPTQAILVDPINGAVTVAIPYVVIDNGGKESTTSGTVSLPFTTASISGNVYNDANGLSDNTVNGTAISTASGSQLYANLLDNNGNVVATTNISGGAYSFSGLNGGNYTVQVSTNQGTVGNPAPATALPSNWINTGENIGTSAGNDGSANGNLPVSITTANITNANFGIEQLPNSTTPTTTSQANPGGTTQVQAVTLAGTDSEDGALGTTNSVKITTLPTNATLYYNGVAVTAGQTITNYNPTLLTLDPTFLGAGTVTFDFAFVDAAGQADPTPATATMNFTDLTISGTVYDDANGLTDNTVNGTGVGSPVSTQLYANLVSGGNVVGSVAVNSNGTYTLGQAQGVLPSQTYSIVISTTQGTVGSPVTSTLPSGWVNTGENLGAGAGNDGTVNGSLAVSIATTNIANANFGIEALPVSNTNTASQQLNPGGTINVTVPASTFTATDADGTVTSIRITAFPTNATSITINGTLYTSATFPVGGVTVPTNASGNPTQTILVDPQNNVADVTIPYVAIDNAGKEGNSSNAIQPFYVCNANAGTTIRN